MAKHETGEAKEQPKWVTHIGEAEGARDMRVELLQTKSAYVDMLEDIDRDLDSAFPTIADTELRPKIIRALEIIDMLTSDVVLPREESAAAEEELGFLELEMMKGMRAKSRQELDVKVGSVFGAEPAASEDHTVIIPEGWQKNIQ